MAHRKDRPRRETAAKTNPVTGTLRIIGGSMRGRSIAYSGDPLTRPMKQRVREAAFNLVGTRVIDAYVIDLFAGTGALSWEALSRGAHAATLIERHFPTARLIRENATALNLTDRIELVAGDTFIWGRQLAARPSAAAPGRPWLVFCSPPYDLYVSHTEPMLNLLRQITDAAPAQSVLVVEADERFDMASLPESYTWDIRPYPPAVLAVGDPH
ncbi:MAG: RsmD family RNA methyltransferase [Pirellulaceae bacterium]